MLNRALIIRVAALGPGLALGVWLIDHWFPGFLPIGSFGRNVSLKVTLHETADEVELILMNDSYGRLYLLGIGAPGDDERQPRKLQASVHVQFGDLSFMPREET